MDSFELNKIIGAILGTLLFVMGVGFLAEAIYHPSANGAGYELPEPEGGEGGEGGGEETPVVSIAVLLASADPVQGADQAKKCGACHDMSETNANKTGPGLYDVVERVIGSHPGFAYSPVMQEHQAAGDTWTYDNLNHFLTAPKAFAPGTKMTFAGVKNDQERANIIAFLSTLSASPKPFPAPEAAPTEPTASEEPAASSEEAPVSSVAPTDVIETPEGTDTSASEAPGGAMTDVPAAPGGDAAVSEAPAMEAPAMESAPVSSEASSAAQ
jgi:cytochrome c